MKAVAFIKRDFRIALNYKLQFVIQFVGIFFTAALTFFVSRLIGGGISEKLGGYGGDYFSFVIVGIALTDYLSVSVDQFSSEIRTAQLEGTLESLLVTPTSVHTILFSSSIYSFAMTSLRVLIYMTLGFFLFGLRLQMTSLAAFAVVGVLTVAAFCGIGLLSAAFILVFKRGSPVSLLVTTASGLLGGVFYPVDVLPGWLSPLSQLLPVTHALEALRQVVLNGAALGAVLHQILILSLFALLLLPLGFVTFNYGLTVAKREASLIHY